MIGVRVVVAVGEKPRDIEQTLVEEPGGDVRQGGVGIDIGVFSDLVDLEVDAFTFWSLDLSGLGTVGGDGDGVPGDQSDGA